MAQRISAYALLFTIRNALFALDGTNVEHLPRILARQYGYYALVGISAALMVVAAWRPRRNGWLCRDDMALVCRRWCPRHRRLRH